MELHADHDCNIDGMLKWNQKQLEEIQHAILSHLSCAFIINQAFIIIVIKSSMSAIDSKKQEKITCICCAAKSRMTRD